MKQDWACVSVVKCTSGFSKLIKALRNDKAELKIPFSKGYLMSYQISQWAGNICNALSLFTGLSQF